MTEDEQALVRALNRTHLSGSSGGIRIYTIDLQNVAGQVRIAFSTDTNPLHLIAGATEEELASKVEPIKQAQGIMSQGGRVVVITPKKTWQQALNSQNRVLAASAEDFTHRSLSFDLEKNIGPN